MVVLGRQQTGNDALATRVSYRGAEKRMIVALQLASWLTNPSPSARVSELIDTISGEQYLSRA